MVNDPKSATLAIAPTTPAYDIVARTLHWTTAALVLISIPIGLIMGKISPGPLQDWLYDVHRSIGATVIPIIIVRLGYRLTHPPVPLSHDVPVLQQRAAAATHWSLYGLLLAQPFIGWIATSAYRAPIPIYALFELPPIWPRNQPFSEFLFLVHKTLGIIIACLVVLHISAALYHHFVRKDGVLLRMITG
jgi:cytochrome b561